MDDCVVAAAPPLKHWRNTSYSTSVNIQDHWSNLLCVEDHFEELRTNDKTYVDPHSPSGICHFPQNDLVPLVLDYGFRHLGLVDISQEFKAQSKIDLDADDSRDVQRFTSQHGHLLLGYEWAGGFTGRLGVENFLRSTTSEQMITCRR